MTRNSQRWPHLDSCNERLVDPQSAAVATVLAEPAGSGHPGRADGQPHRRPRRGASARVAALVTAGASRSHSR